MSPTTNDVVALMHANADEPWTWDKYEAASNTYVKYAMLQKLLREAIARDSPQTAQPGDVS
jgi:hypothetical protein